MKNDLYVSIHGNDKWSGRLAEPNADKTDGPLATITKARDVVREIKLSGGLSGPVTVWIRGGRYPVSNPIVFGPEDSAPVTYAAYPGEQPIIDGGKRIEGWRMEKKGTTKIWVAEVPEVAEGKWYFRQLFVNGERRPRVRLPKKGFYWMENVPGTNLKAGTFEGTDTFQCAPGDIQNWKNLTDVEIVVLHYWIEERMPIASFDEKTRIVKSSRRSMFALKDDVAQRYAKYYVENVFEALSEPGEWYLDRNTGKVYYIPMPGEDIEKTEMFAPVAEQLLKMMGKPEENQYVEFLRFEGLCFQHSEWRQPVGDEQKVGRWRIPEVNYAAAPQAAFNVPGAVCLQGARYCAVEGCRIEHVGWYGVELADGCIANRVVGNEIFDTGAGGVKLEGVDAEGPISKRTGNNKVTDNRIYGGGHVFHSAVGVLSLHSFGNEISHNHIHDFYYSGISCGWVWGYGENVSKNNRIEKNYIHDVGHGLLSDMGGIYTLGVQPGTVIRGNVIHDVEKRNYGGWGIYLDEGSSHMLVENNICYNTSSQGFHQHYGRENIVRNNIFAFGKEGQASLSRAEAHNAFTFEKNIVVSDGQSLFVAGYAGHLEKRKFLSDLNLFWDVSGKQLISGNGKYDANANWTLYRTFTMDELKSLGYDLHSIIADPCFKNLKEFDFGLMEDSPALSLGFQPIDTSDVGPRPRDKRDK